VFGLGNSTTESQQAAIQLAEEIGGIVDTHTSLTHGPSKIGAQLVGKVTCTLGEVKNRADLLIYWGSNPVETHPRHLTKYTFTPKGRHVPGGRRDRTMVVVDVRETPSAKAAHHFLQIRPGVDFELLTVLRALVNDQPFDQRLIEESGATKADLTALVDRMKSARFGVFFYGTGLTQTRGKHMNVAAILSLTAALNAHTKFVAMPMRDHGNEAGADNVLSWLTGYPFGVDFTRGYPRSNPGEFTAVDLLSRREADAALIVAADPWRTMPQAAIDHLERIPHVVIGRSRECPRTTARVHFTAATPGIETAGTAYRMDKVPLPMRPVLRSAHATDQEILRGIRYAVASA
jgi:formylmethanofuran dehydrogenase subunit B